MRKNSKKQKAERTKGEIRTANDTPSAVKYPDFPARMKKIFGDRVLDAGDDFLKYRHREWEQQWKIRPTQCRRSARPKHG
jgi:hypothetical protein